MKILKKINTGFVLTLIVLLILIIYLISVEAKRKSEKLNIEETCKAYVDLIDKYAIMPKDNQKLYNLNNPENTINIENTKKDIEKAISKEMDKLEKDLKTKMIDNDTAIKMQKDSVESYLKNENDITTSVVTNFNREIKKIKKFAFDDDQVTVTFSSAVEKEIKYLENSIEEKELSKKSNIEFPDETITLKNVDR